MAKSIARSWLRDSTTWATVTLGNIISVIVTASYFCIILFFHSSKQQIQLFLERADATSSDDLTLQEFMEHLQRHEKQLHFVFSKLDTNKDGRVTSSEIKVAFKKLGIAISLKEAEKLVSRIDDDNSLDISFEEWRDYLMFHPRSVKGTTTSFVTN